MNLWNSRLRSCHFLVSVIVASLVSAQHARADVDPSFQSKAPSREQLLKATEYNQTYKERNLLHPISQSQKVLRPFADHENVGALFLPLENIHNSKELKKTILENLPTNVLPILVSPDFLKAQLSQAMDFFKSFFDLSRIKVLPVDDYGNTSFWLRDSIPVPVWMTSGKVGAVDAKYFHQFNPDKQVANHFEVELLKLDAYHEGGNFLADTKGNCFIVDNSRAQEIDDDLFYELYGCRHVHRFEHNSGIGHIDERLKFISDELVLTDDPTYVEQLEELGYEVQLLPRPSGRWVTYANSLTINDVVFLPIFDQPTDAAAIKLYEDAGLKVIPLLSVELPERSSGNVHCMTMTFPKIQLRRQVPQEERDSAKQTQLISI